MREEQLEMSEENGDGGEAKDLRWSPDPGGTAPPKCRAAAASPGGGAAPPPPFSDQVLENVLENVLCFLTSRSDRNAASLVCKSWYRAEAQTRLELFIGNCYAVTPARAIDRFRRARSLVLKGKPRFADFNLVPMGWGARLAPWVAAMAPAYPWLERICLKRMTVTDADLVLLSCSFSSFRDLSLICCDGFTTIGLAAIAGNCRHLRSLDLIENDVEDDEDEVMDWVSSFPPGKTCLESLVFDCVGCAVNFDALLALVARSPFLRRLRVNEHISSDLLCQLMVRACTTTESSSTSTIQDTSARSACAISEQSSMLRITIICSLP